MKATPPTPPTPLPSKSLTARQGFPSGPMLGIPELVSVGQGSCAKQTTAGSTILPQPRGFEVPREKYSIRGSPVNPQDEQVRGDGNGPCWSRKGRFSPRWCRVCGGRTQLTTVTPPVHLLRIAHNSSPAEPPIGLLRKPRPCGRELRVHSRPRHQRPNLA